MQPRSFALVGGIILLALGLLSLIPQLNGSAEILPPLMLETSYGMFLGLFALNIVNKLLLIGFGIWGIAAARSVGRSLPMSMTFAKAVFFVMGIGAVLGMIPQTNTLFGYAPLFGNAIWLHAIFAVVGAYYGFTLSMRARPVARTGTHMPRESLVRH